MPYWDEEGESTQNAPEPTDIPKVSVAIDPDLVDAVVEYSRKVDQYATRVEKLVQEAQETAEQYNLDSEGDGSLILTFEGVTPAEARSILQGALKGHNKLYSINYATNDNEENN